MYSTAPATLRFLSPRHLFLVVVAGVFGEIALEIIAWGVAPLVLGRSMQPAILVSNLAGALFGANLSPPTAFLIHLASGIIVFPLGYVLFRRWAAIRSPVVAGVLWGVVLWFVAQAILAPLAGRPFMLGFIPYTWASLAAHIIYTLVIALTYERLSPRAAKRRCAISDP